MGNADQRFALAIRDACKRAKLSKTDFFRALKAAGVLHGRTTAFKWHEGTHVIARSAFDAVRTILQVSYESADEVELVFPGLQWGRESSRVPRAARERSGDSGAIRASLLHHVSLPVNDLEEATEFYRTLLGIDPLPKGPQGRPIEFPFAGTWFQIESGQQLHLVHNPGGTFRKVNGDRKEALPKEWQGIDPRDCHFALRVSDVGASHRWLLSRGIHAIRDPYELGFLQVYFLDLDDHVVELNGVYVPEAGR